MPRHLACKSVTGSFAWKPLLGNLAWEPVLENLSWKPVLGNLSLETYSGKPCLETCLGNLFLGTFENLWEPVPGNLSESFITQAAAQHLGSKPDEFDGIFEDRGNLTLGCSMVAVFKHVWATIHTNLGY